MRPTDAEMMTQLVDLYLRGGVMQGAASQLLGLRKETFAELADLRLGVAALEREAGRYYVDAFHQQFPHCDVKAWRHARHARKPARTSDNSRAPTRAAQRLVEPRQHRTMRDIVPRQHAPDADVRAYLKTHPVPLYKRFKDQEEPELELSLSE